MSPLTSSDSIQRPTLPPIRDLFRDELSQKAYQSPQITLARLRVCDDEDYHGRHSPRPSEPSSSSSRPHQHPGYAAQSPPSRSSRPIGGSPTAFHHLSPNTYDPPPIPRSLSHHGGESYHRPYHPDHSMPDYSHREGMGMSDYRTDPRNNTSPYDSRFGASPAYPPPLSSTHRIQSMGNPPGYPWPISTKMDRSYHMDDDDRTPTARYAGQLPHHVYRYPPPEDHPSNSVQNAKYECQYCGKGFNRPSSLKIHLNSHTGEKPFACPVEGCGRSFSVLSNMRRHARVHNTGVKDKEASSDEGALSSNSHSSSQTGYPGQFADPKWLQRRGSIASSSSTSSRRSRSPSSEDEDDGKDRQPDPKRSRRSPAH